MKFVNLFDGYNEKEDFRILICASDIEEAKTFANEYLADAGLEGNFLVCEAENIDTTHYDCDYVISGDSVKIGKDFKEAFENSLNVSYALTAEGIRKCNSFIRECELKRKEILDAGLDTADETTLPSLEDIISDIDSFIDEDGDYCNSWGVTDNYDSDGPLCLSLGEDFVEYIAPSSSKHRTCTLELILAKHYGCEEPFLENIDGSGNPFTDEGAIAYFNLIEFLCDIGEIAGESMEGIIEALDRIANEEH